MLPVGGVFPTKGPVSLVGAFTPSCLWVDVSKGDLICSKTPPAREADKAEAGYPTETDLMDTAQDMAESMVDVPAKDIKSADDTTKVLGETIFKDGVEETEELEAEDPFLETPIENLGKESTGLTAKEQEELEVIQNQLKSADETFEEQESKDAATEAVLASRKETMKDLDTNADGVLDEQEEDADDHVKIRNPMLVISKKEKLDIIRRFAPQSQARLSSGERE